jgi:hypothetical protein
MEDNEIMEFISTMVHELHDETYDDMDGIYRRTKKLHEELCEIANRLNLRMTHIERMINEHAVGVQNVYDRVNKLID